MILSLVRITVLYLSMVLVIRLMGKRQLGQLEPSEFVVSMMVANLATLPMEDRSISLVEGLLPIAAILVLELLLTRLNLKSSRLRRLLCGKPVILIENGKLLQKNLRRARLTLDELTGQLRQKDILELRSVQYAILETNGSLSVFPYPKERPASARDAGIRVRQQFLPVTVVSDGELLRENLHLAGKDQKWLEQILQAHRLTLADTWLLTVDRAGHVVVLPRQT